MHVARFGASGIEDLIVEASVNNLAYDAQCEDSRENWLMTMADDAKIEDQVFDSTVCAFRDNFAARSFWDRRQLCKLAAMFAKRGRVEARTAIYSSLSRYDKSSDIFGAEEIIELDGPDGLLFVAEKIGNWILNDPNYPGTNYVVDFFDEIHGQGSAERILIVASGNSSGIKAFLNRELRTVEPEGTEFDFRKGSLIPDMYPRFGSMQPDRFDTMKNWGADDIIRNIRETPYEKNRNKGLYARWGRTALDDDLQAVAKALFAEPDTQLQVAYLSVFQRRGLPQFDDRILKFADSDDSDVRWMLFLTLSCVQHHKVRELAFKCLRSGRIVEHELSLLEKNYERRDWATIYESLDLPTEQENLHRVLQDLLDVYETNMLPEAVEPMLYTFENTPCSTCRSRAVRVLKSINALPDWIREECQFDADADTRELVAPKSESNEDDSLEEY